MLSEQTWFGCYRIYKVVPLYSITKSSFILPRQVENLIILESNADLKHILASEIYEKACHLLPFSSFNETKSIFLLLNMLNKLVNKILRHCCNEWSIPIVVLNLISLSAVLLVLPVWQVVSSSKISLTHYQTKTVLDWSILKRIADDIFKCI